MKVNSTNITTRTVSVVSTLFSAYLRSLIGHRMKKKIAKDTWKDGMRVLNLIFGFH